LGAVVLAQVESIRQAQARIVQVGMEERRRLDRDLHDGAQQRLLAVATSIGLASAHTTGEPSRVLTRAGDELREALHELRELAHGLHPALLTGEGLSAALHAVAERLPVDVLLEVEAIRLAPAVESTAYFVIYEALADTVRHACATQVAVRARVDDDRLTFEIRDDGIGEADSRDSGVTEMTDRVRAMGGRLRRRSEPGRGTLVAGWLPLS
jgi:signal transduction histidine kinase